MNFFDCLLKFIDTRKLTENELLFIGKQFDQLRSYLNQVPKDKQLVELPVSLSTWLIMAPAIGKVVEQPTTYVLITIDRR